MGNMVDKCVGPGPGYSLDDDPITMKGSSPVDKKDLNKTGTCFVKTVRSTPDLGNAFSTMSHDMPAPDSALTPPNKVARPHDNAGAAKKGGPLVGLLDPKSILR